MSFESSSVDPSGVASLPSGVAMPVMITTYRVVTGNRLRDGRPVYFAGNGRWSEAFADAVYVAPAAADRLLAEAQQAIPHPVIAPYLIEVTCRDGQLRPASLRERIRAFGPTVRRSG